MRLDALDRSPLAERAGSAARTRLVVTAPVQRGRFDVSAPALILRFGTAAVREPVLFRVPKGRAPPQGAVIETVGELALPRSATSGFDERVWLRRHGVHLILRAERWRVVGRRGGVDGIADRLRERLEHSIARGLRGDRAAVIEGVVLGEDSGLSDEHEGALPCVGPLSPARRLGAERRPRRRRRGRCSRGSSACRGSSVSWPHWSRSRRTCWPSVRSLRSCAREWPVALGSLAWLTRARRRPLASAARRRDRPARVEPVHAPRCRLPALVCRGDRDLRARPALRALPRGLPARAAAATRRRRVGRVRARDGADRLAAVPFAPAADRSGERTRGAGGRARCCGLALATAAVAPVSPSAAAALAWLNGWCAAYLVAVARLVGGLPFAQIQSTRTLLLLLAGALLAAAYALPQWPRPSSSPST